MRQFREGEARIALGRAVGELQSIEQNIVHVAAEKSRAGENFSSLGASPAFDELRNYSGYISRLDAARERLLAEAARAELSVSEARDEYLEALREKRVMDKLKEKRRGEYRREYLRNENKTLDGITASLNPA